VPDGTPTHVITSHFFNLFRSVKSASTKVSSDNIPIQVIISESLGSYVQLTKDKTDIPACFFASIEVAIFDTPSRRIAFLAKVVYEERERKATVHKIAKIVITTMSSTRVNPFLETVYIGEFYILFKSIILNYPFK